MSQGCFYLLPDTLAPEALPAAIVAWVCELTTDLYRQGLGVYIHAQSQAQAELLDEQLWQQPADGFIAHNLQGEGPPQGAQVVIGWQPPKQGRAVLMRWANNKPVSVLKFIVRPVLR